VAFYMAGTSEGCLGAARVADYGAKPVIGSDIATILVGHHLQSSNNWNSNAIDLRIGSVIEYIEAHNIF
jgi:hypothetical protein